MSHRPSSAQTRFVDPASDFVNRAAVEKPLATLFFAVLLAFSFLPILVFLVFSIGTLLVVGGSAFVGTVLVLAWIIGSATMLLIGALSIATFFAVSITSWFVGAYAVYRFAVIVTQASNLPEAIKTFKQEARALVYGPSASAANGIEAGDKHKVRFDKYVSHSDDFANADEEKKVKPAQE
ncbi:hypothetical protein JCM10212_007041 [Sporobolomyces blumeae]